MTVTANLYCNLAAWSNQTYSVGNCVSASGNAYRCTSAGSTPTSPSGTSTLPTSFGSGTSLWIWLSAITFSGSTANAMFSAAIAGSTTVGGLTGSITQPIVWQLWNVNGATMNTASAGTIVLSLTGHSFTPTNNLTITCAPGESFRDKGAGNALAFNAANGVSITLPATTGNQNYFNITDPNVTFDGLQIKDPGATSSSTIINLNNGANNFYLRNCIIDGAGQPSGAYLVGLGSNVTGTLFTNSLIVDRQPANANNPPISDGITSSSTATFVNCTFVAINSQNGLYAIQNNGTGANSWTIRNCVSIGYVSGILACVTNGSGHIDHCGTDAGQIARAFGVGTDSGGELVSQTVANMFVSSTTDFRLKDGSPFLNAGVTDAANIPTANDIFRTTRPQNTAWDMGAFELPLRASSLSETSATSDSYTGTVTASLANTTVTSDSFTGTLVGIYAASLTEAAATSDLYTETRSTVSVSVSETSATSDNYSSTVSSTSLAETSATSDSYTVTGTSAPNRVSETSATSDAYAGTVNASLSVTAVTSDAFSETLVTTPWVTSFCAYSAASFSIANNGTDIGGSIYGVTSAIFAAFPTDMNPASGSAIINAGFTDTAAIPAANDTFGTSRPQGTSWDIGAIELLITARTVSRDFVLASNFQQTVANDDWVSPITWRSGLAVNALAPISWAGVLLSPTADTQMPLEILHAKTFDAASPTEWMVSVGLLATSNAAIPVEWGHTKQSDLVGQMTWLQPLIIDSITPLEFGGIVLSTTADAQMPLEILQRSNTDLSFVIEWLVDTTNITVDNPIYLEILQGAQFDSPPFPIDRVTGMRVSFNTPIEIGAPIRADSTTPVKINALLRRDGVAPTEWGLSIAFKVDANFAIVWRHSLSANFTAGVEWRKIQFGPLNAAFPLSWSAGVAANSADNVAWSLSFNIQELVISSIEWTHSVAVGTAAFPVEIGKKAITDSRAPAATLRNLQRDTLALLERNITVALPTNFVFPIEFAAGVSAGTNDAVAWATSLTVTNKLPLGVGASVATNSLLSAAMLQGVQANAVVPADPGGGVAGTIVAPLEFGHLTFTITIDGTMPLEINSLVVGGIVVPIEPNDVHLTIGAQLEPDAWEWQNRH